MPRTYAGIALREHVARILGRRREDMLRALSEPRLLDQLTGDVIAALRAEHTDHDGTYHAFDPEPFPSMSAVAVEIREFAQTLAARQR